MRICVKVSKFYDWEPLPADVVPTEGDIKAKRVKPSASGGWLMKITKTGDTQTDVALPESQLIMSMIQDMIRDKLPHTRAEAMAHYLARHVMPHHAHPNWMKDFEVHDDGPNVELFESMIKEHVDAGSLERSDADQMLEVYMTPLEAPHHVAHLKTHFGKKGGAK